MIKLSDRLQRIADEIIEGETMADIGTDHGFLPVFLVESGRCPKVIMTDVSPLSLDKARSTAHQHGFGYQVGMPGKENDVSLAMDFRVGDGLSALTPYETDVVVIAGMGGKLIRDIMAADMKLTCSFRKFVMQPRIGQGHLRKWLVDNGFVIIKEGVVHEGRHIPEIITALSPGAVLGKDVLTTSDEDLIKRAECDFPCIMKSIRKAEVDDIIWRIPPWIVYADGPVDVFLIRNTIAEEEKLDNVRRARKRNIEFENEISQSIEYLKHLQELRKEHDDGR